MYHRSSRFLFSKLKDRLAKDIIPKYKDRKDIRYLELNALRKEHGNKVIGEIKLDQAISGMREMPALFYEGSQLDPMSGITFRGHSIPEV
jgi:citrate synthase